MVTLDQNKMSWDVEGPDPVPWPGDNYELIIDTPGFVNPESAAALLNASAQSAAPWAVERPERSNVEEIFSVENAKSPLKIRARIAGMGDHPDMDYVQYVLEMKFLLGEQEDGSYETKEVARGTLDQVSAVTAKMQTLIQAEFDKFCKFKTNHPIIAELATVDALINKLSI